MEEILKEIVAELRSIETDLADPNLDGPIATARAMRTTIQSQQKIRDYLQNKKEKRNDKRNIPQNPDTQQGLQEIMDGIPQIWTMPTMLHTTNNRKDNEHSKDNKRMKK